MEGGDGSLRFFCDWISTDEHNTTAPAEGWEATKGAKWISDRWASWVPFVGLVNGAMPTNCAGPNATATNETSCQLDLAFPDPDAISWTWQYCTEWGFFQVITVSFPLFSSFSKT